MLFETLNLPLDTSGKTTAILFSQTNPNVQECTQPENKSKNKKLPAGIYFLKKVSENLITFFFGGGGGGLSIYTCMYISSGISTVPMEHLWTVKAKMPYLQLLISPSSLLNFYGKPGKKRKFRNTVVKWLKKKNQGRLLQLSSFLIKTKLVGTAVNENSHFSEADSSILVCLNLPDK